ncbi:MAG TPA: DUF5818 domain-containing protein [Vicinamibacterales bacterium]|nr:DUF5818 domain-containing protein [Vicinamibacterales bacterium]
MKPVTLLEPFFFAVLVVGGVWQSAGSRSFTGTITDSECSDANHARMRMGETDPECVKACVDAHGASLVLYDGTTTFALTDQKTPAPFAGRRVTVTGTLDAKTKTITIEKIVAAR